MPYAITSRELIGVYLQGNSRAVNARIRNFHNALTGATELINHAMIFESDQLSSRDVYSLAPSEHSRWKLCLWETGEKAIQNGDPKQCKK